MATAVIMPRQGQSVENCIITSWNKKKGDRVEAGEILFSYETDKSAFDEPSPVSGTVLEIMYGEGDVVDCLENVCVIGEEGEDISSVVGGASSTAAAEAKPETAEAVGEKAEAKAGRRNGSRTERKPRIHFAEGEESCAFHRSRHVEGHGERTSRTHNRARHRPRSRRGPSVRERRL